MFPENLIYSDNFIKVDEHEFINWGENNYTDTDEFKCDRCKKNIKLKITYCRKCNLITYFCSFCDYLYEDYYYQKMSCNEIVLENILK